MNMPLVVLLVCILCMTAQQVVAESPAITDGDSIYSQGDSSQREPKQTTVSAILQISSADVDAKQETSFTLKSAATCDTPPIVDTTKTCCSNAEHANISAVLEVLRNLQKSMDELKMAVAGLSQAPCYVNTSSEHEDQYPLLNEDGLRWRMFWWYTAGTTWPDTVIDVLQDEYGDCKSDAPYCFGRLPDGLQETSAEMLGIDSAGTVYRWKFNPSNDVAHAVWEAFHDHVEGKVTHGDEWNPTAVRGTAPGAPQDSFQYRLEHGVNSLAIDDDNCDCLTSLSMGHGMCNSGFSTAYGPENVFGVDLLYDSHCQTPSPANGLSLYFRDDD